MRLYTEGSNNHEFLPRRQLRCGLSNRKKKRSSTPRFSSFFLLPRPRQDFDLLESAPTNYPSLSYSKEQHRSAREARHFGFNLFPLPELTQPKGIPQDEPGPENQGTYDYSQDAQEAPAFVQISFEGNHPQC